MKQAFSVALIGGGSISCIILRELLEHHRDIRVAGVLVHDTAHASVRRIPEGVPVTSSLDELLNWHPGLVCECAGHEALREHGAAVLKRGIDLVVASVGALADRDIESTMREAAAAGGAAMLIPSGAVGALDALSAAHLGGLDAVRYVGRKPVAAWRGTNADRVVDLDKITEATAVFEGTAREAALAYPQNANVAAAIALAGIGFDATRATLIADPAARANEHEIEAEGRFGRFTFNVVGIPLPTNPRTSTLAAYSLLRSLVAPSRAIRI